MIRKKTLSIVLLILLFTISIGSSGCLKNNTDGENRKAEVEYVVDGDTLSVLLDDEEEKVRILGIDTPEIYIRNDFDDWGGIENRTLLKKCGHRASNFTKNWISKNVTLIIDESEGEFDKYGRMLAYVELQNGTDIGAELIKHGLARVYEEGDCSRESNYLEYQETAKKEKIGVWSGLEN